MINRFVLIAVFVPLAIVLIALAVANRGAVAFTLDPFNPGNPALTWQVPLFALIFAATAIGLLVGSTATWLKQGRFRRLARQRGQEAEALKQNMIRQAPATHASVAQAPSPGAAPQLPRH